MMIKIHPTGQANALVRARRPHLGAARRRGVAIYVLTLMIAMLVTGTAATLLSLQMANRRLYRNLADARQAELAALAGLEWSLNRYQSDPAWRSTASSGAVMPLAGTPGIVTATLTDADGDFQNDDTQPAELDVSADVNGALFKLSVSLDPVPHEALSWAIYASAQVWVLSTATVRGPVFAGGGISNFASINITNNAAFSTLPSGVIFGNVPNVKLASFVDPFPPPTLAYYLSRATDLIDGGGTFTLRDASLTSTFNSKGLANPDGIYHIDAGGRSVDLDSMFLRGTLIITNTGSNDVTFRGGCRLEPGPAGYPTLLVSMGSGNLTFTPNGPLDEPASGVDFNRDGDKLDVIAPGVYGIVWTNAATTTLGGTDTTYRGSIIAREVDVSGSVTIDDDPGLANLLRHGFTDNKLHLRRGSVRETAP